MPGIGIILNPHSRSNRKNPERIKRLGFIVGEKGSCKLTRDIVDIPVIVHEFKEKKIDILGISGGDGTNHCTLTSFIEEYGDTPLPKIAFLRGGTMNAIANALDIHGSPEQILSNLILKYHEEQEFETSEVDLLNVNGKYGFLFGNGLVARFIERYYENKGGPLTALWLFTKVTVETLFNIGRAPEMYERYDAEVIVDGEPWDFKNFTFIDAGTMESFCFGFKPLYRARQKPGYFQIMGCTATPRGVISTLPRTFMGKQQLPKYYKDSLAKRVEIKLSKPMSYMIDGDMQDPKDHIILETGPRLNVIVR